MLSARLGGYTKQLINFLNIFSVNFLRASRHRLLTSSLPQERYMYSLPVSTLTPRLLCVAIAPRFQAGIFQLARAGQQGSLHSRAAFLRRSTNYSTHNGGVNGQKSTHRILL